MYSCGAFLTRSAMNSSCHDPASLTIMRKSAIENHGDPGMESRATKANGSVGLSRIVLSSPLAIIGGRSSSGLA